MIRAVRPIRPTPTLSIPNASFRRWTRTSLLVAASLCAGSAWAADPAPLSTVEGDVYSIAMADAKLKAGGEGRVIVTVKAKSGYHVNDKYPHKVKVDEPPRGLEVAKRELKKDDGKFKDPQTFELAIPVKAASAGSYTLAVEVKTSVCSDTKCLMKTERLTAKLTAE